MEAAACGVSSPSFRWRVTDTGAEKNVPGQAGHCLSLLTQSRPQLGDLRQALGLVTWAGQMSGLAPPPRGHGRKPWAPPQGSASSRSRSPPSGSQGELPWPPRQPRPALPPHSQPPSPRKFSLSWPLAVQSPPWHPAPSGSGRSPEAWATCPLAPEPLPCSASARTSPRLTSSGDPNPPRHLHLPSSWPARWLTP